MLTMTAASDPIGNGAWSLVIKTLPIDCLKGSLGTITGKSSISTERQFYSAVAA